MKLWRLESWNIWRMSTGPRGCMKLEGVPLPKNYERIWTDDSWLECVKKMRGAVRSGQPGCLRWGFEMVPYGAPHLKMPGEFQASQPTAEIGLNHWWILMIPLQTWLVGPWNALNSVTCSPFFWCIIDEISSAMRLTATFTYVTWWELQCLLCPHSTPIPLILTQTIGPQTQQIHKRLFCLKGEGESRGFNQLGFPKSWSYPNSVFFLEKWRESDG